jgi:hypothetical protein
MASKFKSSVIYFWSKSTLCDFVLKLLQCVLQYSEKIAYNMAASHIKIYNYLNWYIDIIYSYIMYSVFKSAIFRRI